jgi:hypothetical protein
MNGVSSSLPVRVVRGGRAAHIPLAVGVGRSGSSRPEAATTQVRASCHTFPELEAEGETHGSPSFNHVNREFGPTRRNASTIYSGSSVQQTSHEKGIQGTPKGRPIHPNVDQPDGSTSAQRNSREPSLLMCRSFRLPADSRTPGARPA